MRLFNRQDRPASTIVQALQCCNESFEVHYSSAWSLQDRATWLNHEMSWHLQGHVMTQAEDALKAGA